MKKALIALRELSFSYRGNGRSVFRNLSLDLDEGKVSAVLGPNGVGKTTLLYIMLGWLSPVSGNVVLNGKSLSSYTQRERGKWMSLVPKREHIPFEYSMLEYVLLGRAPYLKPLESPGKEDIRIGTDALVSVGLDPEDKAHRVKNFVEKITKGVGIIAHSCGVPHPRALKRFHCRLVQDTGKSLPLNELYPEPEVLADYRNVA